MDLGPNNNASSARHVLLLCYWLSLFSPSLRCCSIIHFNIFWISSVAIRDEVWIIVFRSCAVSTIRGHVSSATAGELESGKESTDRRQARADQADRWLDVCPERSLVDRIWIGSPLVETRRYSPNRPEVTGTLLTGRIIRSNKEKHHNAIYTSKTNARVQIRSVLGLCNGWLTIHQEWRHRLTQACPATLSLTPRWWAVEDRGWQSP